MKQGGQRNGSWEDLGWTMAQREEIKRILKYSIQQFKIPLANLEEWYNIAINTLSSGSIEEVYTKDEMIKLSAAFLKINYGELHLSQTQLFKKKLLFSSVNYDHPIKNSIFEEYKKLRDQDIKTLKTKFINLTRILKRLIDNIFPCLLYTVNNNNTVSLTEIFLIISEKIITLEKRKNDILYEIPIDSVKNLYYHHTSNTEREIYQSVRKRINSSNDLNLLVIDLGGDTLSILTKQREKIKDVYEDFLNGYQQLQHLVWVEKMEALRPSKKISFSLTHSATSAWSKIFVDIGEKLVSGNIEITDDSVQIEGSHSWKCSFNNLKAWKRIKITFDMLKDPKYANCRHTTGICFESDIETVTILGELTVIYASFKAHKLLSSKEEFECVFSRLQHPTEAVLAITPDYLLIKDLKSGEIRDKIPSNQINDWLISVAPSEIKKDFYVEGMILINLDSPPALSLYCNDTNPIEIELKKIIAILWNKHQNEQFSTSAPPASNDSIDCKIFSKGEGKYTDVTLTQNAEILSVLNQKGLVCTVPLNSISGWTYGINLAQNKNLLLYYHSNCSNATASIPPLKTLFKE